MLRASLWFDVVETAECIVFVAENLATVIYVEFEDVVVDDDARIQISQIVYGFGKALYLQFLAQALGVSFFCRWIWSD